MSQERSKSNLIFNGSNIKQYFYQIMIKYQSCEKTKN